MSDDLTPELAADVLTIALETGGELAEIFFEDVEQASVNLDDGRIESLASSRDRGVGIRVIDGERTGFAHTADLSAEGLRSTARAAAASIAAGKAGSQSGPLATVVDFQPTHVEPGEVQIHPATVGKADKVAALRTAEETARSRSEAITQVAARYAETRRRIRVINSEGLWADDDQTRTLFSVNSVASGDVGLQTGNETVGLSMGYELLDRYDVADLATKAADRALTKLEARPAPAGTFEVVIGPGSGGVLFHEACGHGLEADLVRKKASAFAGRVGEQVASPLVTLVDDGAMDIEWGHLAIDDEGHRGQRNVLIEDGVLVDYMWDTIRARQQGRTPSGNGRRQSYRHLPMVRMTNTFLEAGVSTPEEIIASVDHGVYVARLGGGQVNTATGDFVFGMVEAYMIENGQITAPLREGQLIGNGPKVLTQIEAVGNDFEMGPPGTCGKDGQGVPVGDGVPTLKVTELTIGGTAA